MANKFNTGDKVSLKTGGPVMTIKGHAATHTSNGNIAIIDKYECTWYDGKKTQQAVFIEDILKLMSKL
ncbi:MAG: DUF2158 domain-containing protein [Panacibacter sp.]